MYQKTIVFLFFTKVVLNILFQYNNSNLIRYLFTFYLKIDSKNLRYKKDESFITFIK